MLVLLLLTLSAVLLTIIQPPVNLSLLAFVALVPFILACIYAERLWSLLLASYVIALLYWLFNLYWLIPVTTAGLVAGCLYLAALWPLAAVAIRFCYSKKIPLVIAVPVIFVGAERLQGFFLGGFFWRFCAQPVCQSLYYPDSRYFRGSGRFFYCCRGQRPICGNYNCDKGEKNLFQDTLFRDRCCFRTCSCGSFLRQVAAWTDGGSHRAGSFGRVGPVKHTAVSQGHSTGIQRGCHRDIRQNCRRQQFCFGCRRITLCLARNNSACSSR